MRKIPALLLAILALPLLADEGKWTPQQVLQLDPKLLAAQGLQIPPERLWDPQRGTGLLSATIDISGCSAGWISADGLFITNHHCLFDILQEHATPENDIITNGFLARTRDQELRSRSSRVLIPRRFTDVSARVLAAIPPKATDAERWRSIEKTSNAIVAECEKQPGMRCRVAAHDGGVQYVLQESAELSDVRLVYAPPREVGEYGGEVDNWMWPRHTGDFSIARAYVDGKPYRPEFFFPLSRTGVQPGDFIMVMGYPGITYRALTADEMEERILYFTRRADLYREWIDILRTATAGDPAGEIAVADTLKSLLNRQKNAEGQLAGFRRGAILAKQRAADENVLGNKASAGSTQKTAATAYAGLAALAAEKKATFERDFLLDHLRMTSPAGLPAGPKELVIALTIARGALERQKPDDQRESLFMQRNATRLADRFEREQKNFFPAADRRLFESFVRRAQALPAGQRIAAIDALFPASAEPAARIAQLYSGSQIFDAGERAKMLTETPAQLHARKDPLIEAGFTLAGEIRELNERKERWDGTISRLRPEWRRAVAAASGGPLAPDANSTLRFTYGHVKGYAPRDAVWYQPQTTLAGVLEKHTGEAPFDVPDEVIAAAAKRSASPFRDAKLGDVPVDFLGDCDTTGGNSGSPTVNGRGELVGVNFDRVWENVANDFGYNPDVARQVNVDVRYILWMLSGVSHATELLEELGVRP
jgi:hypothetical protein